MIKVFVAIPPKYGDETDVRTYVRRIEEAAHMAEKILDQYVEITNREYSFLTEKKTAKECVKGFIFNCLHYLCLSDIAVFAGDWEHCKEGRILHSIAVSFDIPILNIDTTFPYSISIQRS